MVFVVMLATIGLVTSCAQETGRAVRANPGPTITQIAPTALIVDASDSMTTDDAPGPRIDAAKRAATGLVNALPDGSHVALLTYGTGTGTKRSEHAAGCKDVRTLVPLGPLDRDTVNSAIAQITPRGFTPIAESLRAAAELLPAQGEASIVLISDGEDTCQPPPCEVAQQLKRANSHLEISTVGFRTDGDASAQLRCIAEATGGLFVEAANEAQLAARLLATQDQSGAARINGAGLEGIELGMSLSDIRDHHSDFPADGTRDGDLVVYHWHDCDWGFTGDGTLTSIRPADSVRTIDGVGRGSTVDDAIRFYGDPLATTENSDGTYTLTFDAGGSEAAYQITATGTGGSATIERIVVCRCLPKKAADLPSAPPGGLCSARHVTSQADYRHPELGDMRLFTLTRGGSGSARGNACIVAVPADGEPIVIDGIAVYQDELNVASPVSDATGNAFVTYNPGRYNGVYILVPTKTGFQPLKQGQYQQPTTGVRNFYNAELKGPGGDGKYTIETTSIDCNPSCADGTLTKETLAWNGSDYVKE